MSKLKNKHTENWQLIYYDFVFLFLTDILSLEESNSRLTEKVTFLQDTLQALGEDLLDLVYHHAIQVLHMK